jgi:hypothetical protein
MEGASVPVGCSLALDTAKRRNPSCLSVNRSVLIWKRARRDAENRWAWWTLGLRGCRAAAAWAPGYGIGSAK